jgi:hypothetical protein
MTFDSLPDDVTDRDTPSLDLLLMLIFLGIVMLEEWLQMLPERQIAYFGSDTFLRQLFAAGAGLLAGQLLF